MRNPLPALARVLAAQRWVMRLADQIVWVDKQLHRLSRGRVGVMTIAGVPSLRLISTGRKTGLRRENNLLCHPRSQDYLLVASNWGRRSEPGWAYNLRAHPEAIVAVRGREIAVRAREVTGAEYDDLWRLLLDSWPGYGMERALAQREFPIFVLTPRAVHAPEGRLVNGL